MVAGDSTELFLARCWPVLTRIELTNFMSHADTVIEPASGLTVLVGPNNCGKSAVVAALQILCHNSDSTFVLRHGEKECKIAVHTADGHVIEWRRKKSPSYTIDGEAFDRLGKGGVPETLETALRLCKVEAGDDTDFDVHFGAQKSPIFLLDKPGTTAAKFFAASSDAIRLVQMQRRHKEKVADRQREKNRLEAESQQLVAVLEALEPAVEIDQRVKAAESLHGELVRLADWLVQAERDSLDLHRQVAEVAYYGAVTATHVTLSSPPVLELLEPLEKLLAESDDTSRKQSQAAAESNTLAALLPPPTLAVVEGLAGLVQQISTLERTADRGHAARQVFEPLLEPPLLTPLEEHQRLIEVLSSALSDAQTHNECRVALASLVGPPPMHDEVVLRSLIERLATAAHETAGLHEAVLALVAVELPPDAKETQPLIVWLQAYESAQATHGDAEEQLSATLALLADLEEEAAVVAATTVCPTCGSDLDAARLLSRMPGPGGHIHVG